nr:immunoglobulin heavy chain junction region [Macaca mulatta]MOW19082.1 immunoglobulin heavy chain junction region [Macaca mulatta]MOW19315.1 immunoglobulin heavy chain junction region [Macaca mulatta]MOW19340.1 immunoglobulin heavy chain junction region [Macaca mulatta]MOW21297.1 immunoglobulin heavy chain junction region [Macaca mulatta]
CARIQVEFDVW